MLALTGKTRLVGVFGHPVGHSLSPCMHNSAFAALGMDWAYLAFDVPPEKLSQALRALPALGLRGVNLTIPHKEAAAGIVDELSPFARLLGAVNTVQVEGERLLGHNTDGTGFLRSLADIGVEPEGRRVVLLGAGGAARAIAVALAEKRVAGLVVANRTRERAIALARRTKEIAPQVEIYARGLGEPELQGDMENASLVVNSTAVGMYPQVDAPAPIPPDWLRAGQTVVDIVYRPRKTRLLAEAEARGCQTLNGVRMLVLQGAEAFSLWTDCDAPVEVMEEALLKSLAQEGVA